MSTDDDKWESRWFSDLNRRFESISSDISVVKEFLDAIKLDITASKTEYNLKIKLINEILIKAETEYNKLRDSVKELSDAALLEKKDYRLMYAGLSIVVSLITSISLIIIKVVLEKMF